MKASSSAQRVKADITETVVIKNTDPWLNFRFAPGGSGCPDIVG
jgi:hypothetical protein